jgi:hypothetical protein
MKFLDIKGEPPMLKIYTLRRWASVNNEEWREIWPAVDVMRDDALPNEVVAVNQMSFDEFYNALRTEPMIHIQASTTLFRKRPIISIDYDFDHTKHYTCFDTISCKYTYEEVINVSLYNIVRFFSADQTIQYLKERGITTCPMNF